MRWCSRTASHAWAGRAWLYAHLSLCLCSIPPLTGAPAVVINELHYHPVEEPAFDASGAPLMDLSEDVHEFVELFNPSATNVPLAGWQLSGGISFDFPGGAVLPAHGFLVIAKNPPRLAAVAAYGLTVSQILGPWSGQLGNSGDTVRLKNERGEVVDSVSYSASFPWAIGADGLGADEEWTGLRASDYQYRGRSLERVSASWSANDPANWLASPAPGNPSPGRSNAVTLVTPRPVVTAFAAYQDSDGETMIRAGQTVRIDCTFSATNDLSNVSVEFFIDDINTTNEARSTVAMAAVGAPADAAFTAVLPGQPDRSIVRYRLRANRGAGVETVSPRPDDPFAWHAFFITPTRSSTNRIYECFISAASLNTLATNINQGPRRITYPDPPGMPRASWNATEPAVFVFDGEVFDIRMRHHGSQYRRSISRNSFKWQFPRYHRFEGRDSAFVTDKTAGYIAGGVLYRAAGVPFSYARWVDLYLNSNGVLTRLEEDEMDDKLFDRLAEEWQRANPGSAREAAGEFYKAQGMMPQSDPTGPYGGGGFYRLAARPPYWTELDRYVWTYALQMHGWKGGQQFQQLLQGLWAARGDAPTSPNPNLSATRAFLETNFDVDTTLTYLAIRNWSCGWDDIFHNWFAWRRANGKWAMLAWDLDNELGGRSASTSIFVGELGDPSNAWAVPNWLKDSFFKAFRNEYKEKLFLLNNTLLDPTNIAALGLDNIRSFAQARFASVNFQLGFGPFQRPLAPTAVFPANGQAVLPPTLLQASAYAHSAAFPPTHAATTWFIRHADGSYAAPVFKLTCTASNLTSLPIPFDQLAFGETYFWKCFYTDANGHPSLESAESAFVFGGQAVTVPLVALDATTQWRFNQSGILPAPEWKAPDFDDSAWPQGPALLGSSAGALPEPIRTTLTIAPNTITFYFRATFLFPGDPAGARLRLRHVVDDGLVLYLNGVEVLRTGMRAGSVTASTTAARNVGNAVYEGPFTISSANLAPGTNVLAAEVHQFNSSSSDIAFGLTLDALVPPAPGGVVLNEILADNRAIANGGRFPDYIELYNATDRTQDLNGLSLSDDALKPGKYVFPPGATIPPSGYLLVWCDDRTNAPGLHTGFALDNDGQTVALFSITTNGYTLADSVTFGLQAQDFSIGRVSGVWRLNVPTPGAANREAALGSPSSLKINEWMATDAGGPDWLELYNPSAEPVALGGLHLTDDLANPTRSVIAALSFIAPTGYRQLIADEDLARGARHVDFRLSGGGEAIGLYDADLAAIDAVTFGPQTSGVSEGRLPDGAANIVFFPATPTPEDANYRPLTDVVINEVLAHSDPPLEDLIELFNPTAGEVDVSGWWLSDRKSDLRKFRLPTNSILPPGGFLVFSEHEFNASAETGFALNGARGDEVYLAAVDSTGELTGYRADGKFGPAENGVSHGRFATSQGVAFVALSTATFGAANTYARVGPVVITEIMYHPSDFFDGSDNTRAEFIELRNLGPTNVALFDPAHPTNTWRLRDAVDFSFPTNVMLAPGEPILAVHFDPATNAAALDAFLDAYGSAVYTTRLFGPFTGKLDNSSDSVELVKPDAPVTVPGPDLGYVPAVLVDKVHYTDATPWPSSADGSGASLQRRVLTAYGDDPTNWFAAAPTPGTANSSNALPSVALTVPATALVGPTNILLTAQADDPDGYITKVEFFDGATKLGEATSRPFSFLWADAPLGTHPLSARARDNLNAAAVSTTVALHVVSHLTMVALTTPADASLCLAGTSVPIVATASNAISPVTSVEFLVDGVPLGADATPPYTATWTAIPGAHTLAAVAIDSSGLHTTSAPVAVSVQAVLNTNLVLVASDAFWKYLDDGSDQGTNWIGLGFDDAAWGTGQAQFGYGDGDETTLINFGPDPNNRYITYYFRRKFQVDSLDDVRDVTLSVLRDDGARAYLNGVEVFRNNLPDGPIDYRTVALTSAAGIGEVTFYPTNIDPGLLAAGPNVLAIEVHQVISNSVDMSFAATLTMTRYVLGPAILVPPQSRTEVAGATVTFGVTATGSAPLSYQWRLNNTPIAGATLPTLVVGDITSADAGAYTVTVANSIGEVTSAPATLVVISPLHIASSWNAANGRFTLSFAAHPDRSSTILASTNLQSWSPVASFGPADGTIVWEDDSTPDHAMRFYRVEQ